ncbi:MAG: hypothetical protein DSZ03_03470 [Sulfurimonas sp.]|nr:MAG: hypothetical protein DSZ03_03470 [Sulfurimonas sp.]
MSKLVLALLSGMFFTFILDFFLFLSFKLHYIDRYGIDLYYNILFADNQNGFWYLAGTIILGYFTIYFKNMTLTALLLGVLFAGVIALNIIPAWGEQAAKMVFMKPKQRLFDGRHIYHGDIYYDGRNEIYMYDNDLQRIITITKKDIKP